MTDIPDGDGHLDSLLRQANPVSEHDLPLPAESLAAQNLYQRITGSPYAGSPKRDGRLGRRRIIPLIAAALGVAGLGGVTAYALNNNTVVHHFALDCYVAPSLSSEAVAVDTQAAGPVSSCAQAWNEGHVGRGPTPLLAACVTPQGVTAVFPTAPGADVCAQLGLAALPAGADVMPNQSTTTTPPTTVDVGGLSTPLRDAIVSDLQASCVDAAQAQVSIDALLVKTGVAWKVSVPTPFPAGRPCASPGFDEADRTIILTGVPPA